MYEDAAERTALRALAKGSGTASGLHDLVGLTRAFARETLQSKKLQSHHLEVFIPHRATSADQVRTLSSTR